MGCVTTRSTAEESALSNESLKTGFEKQPVEAIVSAVHGNSTAGFIIASQFEAIKKRLALNANEKDNTALCDFYKHFNADPAEATSKIQAVTDRIDPKQIEKATPLREEGLLVTAVLLSASNPRQKAEAWFHHIDVGASGTIPVGAVRDLMTQLFGISVDVLPSLSKQKDGEEVKKYLTKAREHLTKAVDAVVPLLTTKDAPTVALEHFATQFATLQGGQLATPWGLRKYMVDQAPKPQLAANPPAKDSTATTATEHKADDQAAPKALPKAAAPAEEAKQP